MSTHDYDIANQTGANFRSDLNLNLAAILSTNSGTSVPTTSVAGTLWADTTNNLLKVRDASNTIWITIGALTTAAGGNAVLTGEIGSTVQAYDADLSTVATNGVGTGANQIVQMTSDSRLPAVNATNLTNLNAGNLTGTMAAIDGSALTGMNGILQLVSATNIETTLNTGGSWITIVEATITPTTATSKIIIMGTAYQDALSQAITQLFYQSTSLGGGGNISYGVNYTTNSSSYNRVHEPAVTSSVTYSIKGFSSSSTGDWYQNRSGSSSSFTIPTMLDNCTSSIILIEVEG